VDHNGRPVSLGPKLGAGGEATVFDIAGVPTHAAKVYDKPASAQRDAKLRALVGMANADLLKIAAWPVATLHERPGGPGIGLAMPKIPHRTEIHVLYSPAHRKTAFPHADWAFLVHTARNCAAAFHAVHSAGVVVGDVNQSNVLVSPQSIAYLIDCDSFQVE